MGRHAQTVYTEPEDIARIECMVAELPSQARVRIVVRNGDVITGCVTERPALQLYEDPAGNEGFNAEVRIDDPAAPPWTVYLWLGDIARVERLDPPN
ncbi:MAG TPA: DUF3247 family protein [Rudaea sp.]|nr:DUF3247 family protein [Rudaea sp.]